MASRSLNKVLLIGNLTRDPELRYTPQGTAVCTFGVATNRSWMTEEGERKEETEFHTVIAWNKLAEICAEYLTKGKQVYIDGRLSTREWEDKEGNKRRTTEIVANEVIFLGGPGRVEELSVPEDLGEEEASPEESKKKEKKSKEGKKEGEDIPF